MGIARDGFLQNWVDYDAFTELGNVERALFWVEENLEYSFEHAEFEVPLSRSRGSVK